MKFVHRIGFRASTPQRRDLDALGLKVKNVAMPGGGDPFVAFDVAEEDPSWPRLSELLQKWGISEGQVWTEFSAKEISAAQQLQIGAWHHGYPQPDEDDFGYLRATYDLSGWCESCGVGKTQRAPFQMKGEPQWGRNGIMQLTWVYDELFVTPKVWRDVFEPAGVGCRPVTNTMGVELTTVIQLVIEDEVGIVTEGLSFERCEACGRLKYLPVTRGAFPALAGVPHNAISRTREYFGSGAQADRAILVSREIAGRLASAKVRGGSLRPVATS